MPQDNENYIGQLLLYLVGAHLQRFKILKNGGKALPILGLYMKGLSVCIS